jgi:hypothetical protein
MSRRIPLAMFWIALVTLANGCQRLNDNRTIQLEAGDVKTLNFNPPRYQQNLTLVITPSGSAVDLYVVNASMAQKTRDALLNEKKPDRALLVKEGIAKEETLNLKVPAGTGYAIILAGARFATSVQLTITGR